MAKNERKRWRRYRSESEMCPLEGNRKITGFPCIKDAEREGRRRKLKNHEGGGAFGFGNTLRNEDWDVDEGRRRDGEGKGFFPSVVYIEKCAITLTQSRRIRMRHQSRFGNILEKVLATFATLEDIWISLTTINLQATDSSAKIYTPWALPNSSSLIA